MAAVAAHPIFLLTLALAPCALILAYYLFRVRAAPEPWPRVLSTCLAGAVAFLVAAELQRRLLPYVPRDNVWLWAFAVVAPSEEILKLAAVLLAAPWPGRYVRLSSGVVFGVAASVGFAAAENIAYVTEYGTATAILRAVTAVPAHALHGTLIGLGLGVVHRAAQPLVGWRLAGVAVLVAVALHGAYDGLLLGGGAFKGTVVGLLLFEGWMVRLLFTTALRRDLQRDIDLLQGVPVLAKAPIAAVRILAEAAVRRQVGAGRSVVRAGRPGDAMFIILRGQLEVRRDDETIATLAAGQFFGEMALITGGPRNADVFTVTEALLMRVPALALFGAVDRVEGLAEVLVEAARSRRASDLFVPSSAQFKHSARSLVGLVRARAPSGNLAKRLAALPILSDLDADDLEALAEACLLIRRGPATNLVRTGRAGFGLCLLLAGEATVRVRGSIVARLVDGDFFGEVSLLTGWPATASVRSVSPVELALLRWQDLEAVLARNPKIGWRLLDFLTERVKTTDGTIASSESLLTSAVNQVGASVRRLVGWRLSGADEDARALLDCFVELRTLPYSAAETLAQIAEPARTPLNNPPAGLWLGSAGEVSGLRTLLEVHARSRGGPRYSGPPPGAVRWWFVPKARVLDGIARCPEVLRFLARLVVNRRQVTLRSGSKR